MRDTILTEVINNYDAILLDAYGVLVYQDKPIAEAKAFLETLQKRQKPYWVVTNDALRSPETLEKRFYNFGLPIAKEAIITSGSLLKSYFKKNDLQGGRFIVLGSEQSGDYLTQAQGELLRLHPDAPADGIVVCDDSGFDFLPGIETALTVMLNRIDQGHQLHLILCNPDVLYPKDRQSYGFTAGAVAMLLEAGLRTRYGKHAQLPSFVGLGKPYAPMFEEAVAKAASRNVLMIGDQLETDVRGACNFGIDSALLATGLATSLDGMPLDKDITPTYWASKLR